MYRDIWKTPHMRAHARAHACNPSDPPVHAVHVQLRPGQRAFLSITAVVRKRVHASRAQRARSQNEPLTGYL